MSNVGYGAVQIIPSFKGFGAALGKGVTSEAKQVGVDAGKAVTTGVDEGTQGAGEKIRKNVESPLRQLAGVVGGLFIGNKIRQFVGDSVEAASNLNETISKSQVIFGDGAAAIEDFGEKAAKNLGQSKQQAIDAAAQFAVFGKAAGLAGQDLVDFSEKSTTLASDLASFFNTSPDQAVQAIGAAFRGEAEPIRQYGVLLDDATLKQEALKLGLISTATDALTPTSRTMAAYQLILDQTKDAQGDFARTSDGLANSQRIANAEAENAKASFGQTLLPIMTQVQKVMGFVAGIFAELPGPVQTSVVALAGLAALAPTIKIIAEGAQGLGPALKSVGSAAAGLGPSALLSVGALAGLVAIVSQVTSQQDQAAKVAQAYTDVLKSQTAELERNSEAFFAKSLLDADTVKALATLGISTQQFTASLRGGGEASDVMSQRLFDLKNAGGAAGDAADQLLTKWGELGEGIDTATSTQINAALANEKLGRSAVDAAAKATLSAQGYADLQAALEDGVLTAGEADRVNGDLSLTIAKLNDSTATATGTQAALGTAMGGTSDAAVTLGAEVGRTYSQTELLAKAFDANATEADNLKNAIDKLVGGHLDLDAATDATIAAQQKITQSLKDNGATLDENTDKGRANKDAIRESISAELDYVDAFIKGGGTVEDASTKVEQYRQSLINQLVQSGLSEDAAQQYIDTLGLTPDNVTTAIALANDEKAKADAQAWVDKLKNQNGADGIPAEVISSIQADIDEGAFQEAKRKLAELEVTRFVKVVATAVGQLPFVGNGGGTQGASGGIIPGAPGAPFPLTAHGGEVLLNDTQATKALWTIANGAPMPAAGDLPALNPDRAGVSIEQTFHGVAGTPQELGRMAADELTWALRTRAA